MIGVGSGESVYLACGFTDMRKSINGLAAIVQMRFNLDPFSPTLFVFCGRKKDRIKILRWDHNGFWLYYRRLETGKFQWPQAGTEKTVRITHRELGWLLDGLSLVQRQAHKESCVTLIG